MMSGCIDGESDLQAGDNGSTSATNLKVGHSDFNDTAEWVAYEIDPASLQPLVLGSARQFAWERGVGEAAKQACSVTSVNGTGPLEPVVMPRDVGTMAMRTATNLRGGFQVGDTEVHAHVDVVGTGFGISLLEITAIGPAQPVYAMVGVDDASTWDGQVADFNADAALENFSWRPIEGGTMSCYGGLDALHSGTYVELPSGVVARDRYQEITVERGVALWIRIEGDAGYRFVVKGPNGIEYAKEQPGVSIGGPGERFLVCGTEAGTWQFQLEHLYATTSENADVRLVMFDASPTAQRALACLGEPGIYDAPILDIPGSF